MGWLVAVLWVGALEAADLATEADLRAAILRGTGAHALTAEIILTADLPSLPAASAFSLDGRNHSISGRGAFSMFKCPDDSTVLTLENLTLKDGYTDEHGAAVSSGRGIVVQREIPGAGWVPIMIDGSKTNRVILRNCVLKDNVSAKSGGAVFVHLEGEPGQPYLLIENSAIIGNTVLKGPAIPTFKVNAEYNNGGGIWERVQSYKSDVIIRNTTLSGNTAPELAGGILIGESAGPVDQAMAVKLFHCTVVNNEAGLAGGAFWHDHSLLLDHSIVHGNSVGNDVAAKGANFAGPGTSLTIRWSVLGYRGDENGLPIEQRCQIPVKGYSFLWENNNLSADPLLSPLPVLLAAKGPYGGAYDAYVHIFDPSSPVYNAGDPGLVAGQGSAPAWDQRGEPRQRVSAGRIDIGSYEFETPIVNDPPAISAIESVRILEDQSGRIAFTVSDKETPPESLSVTLERALSRNIQVEQKTVNGGSRVLAFRPARDYNTAETGPQAITVLVQDGMGAAAKRMFSLEITSVNDKPSLRGPADTLYATSGAAISPATAGRTLTHDFGFLGRADKGDDSTMGLEKNQRIAFELLDPGRPGSLEALTLNRDDGVLSLTPKAGLMGEDTVRVRFRLRDDGGTRDNGVDTSVAYSIVVVIRGGVAVPVEPPVLEVGISGLVSTSRMTRPIPLANAILMSDSNASMAPAACFNCSGAGMEAAWSQLHSEPSERRFRPYLISLKINGPVRYALKFFSTLGTYVNRAEGEIDATAWGKLKRDAAGRATVHLYWWPVTGEGQQAATEAYIVRGSVAMIGKSNGAQGAWAAPPISREVSSRFGYLRR
jgi:hypothetical protein